MTSEADNSNKRGVAIIIVLGMMAIFMMAGVAFSISMRLERLGASNFKYGAQSRHMLWGALAHAMEQIDASMVGPSTNMLLYPDWDILTSIGTNTIPGRPARVLTAAVLDNQIPQDLFDLAWNLATNCFWEAKTTRAYGMDMPRGRYAYMILNMSGYLDANYVGGMTHMYGGDPNEICVTGMPSVVDEGQFVADRVNHIRYETLPDLAYHNSGIDQNIWPTLMCVDSLAKVGDYLVPEDDPVAADRLKIRGKVAIGYDLAGLETAAVSNAIRGGLIRCGIDAAEVDFVYTNLLDYVDADCVPRHLDSPCTEKVPMFSEFVWETRYGMTSGVVRVRSRIHLEFHYPFVMASSNDFYYHVEAVVGITNMSTMDNETIVTNVSEQIAYSGQTNVYIQKMDAIKIDVNIPGTNGATLELGCLVRGWVTVGSPGGSIVDAAPAVTNGWTNWIILGTGGGQGKGIQSLPVPADGAPDVISIIGKETVDPRFNWGTGRHYWSGYQQRPHTLGLLNAWTTNWWYAQRPGLVDEGMAMHVSDGGRIFAVGELGHLLVGRSVQNEKFNTIRLFETTKLAKHEVYETFCMTNRYRRGLVNMNSPHYEVLASVFEEIPVGPPGPGVVPLADGKATELANALLNWTNDFTGVEQLGMTNVIDWRVMFPSPYSDLQRETIYSHAAGLLTARQNLFVVLIKADAYTMTVASEMGSVLSSARAMAIVWRDPYPVQSGGAPTKVPGTDQYVHRWQVRYFKITDD